MAYRNGTYIAFHANGIKQPSESDMKYYLLLTAWKIRGGDDFSFIDSHDKTGAIRDWSKRQTVEHSLKERLRNSKHMLLIIGETTREDEDFVPLEIDYAVDTCEIPIIAAYPEAEVILEPLEWAHRWPLAFARRIGNGSARVIHVPFKKAPLQDAINTFNPTTRPPHGRWFYDRSAYRQWGLL